MKTTIERYLGADSHDSLTGLLQSWRLWLLGAVGGALLALGLITVFPPAYRARAVVIIDHNLEEVWDFAPAENFYFLTRETRKLQDLAWSDETLQLVVDEVRGTSVGELRDEVLMMSQPSDGGWHLWAKDEDPARAEEIARAWAYAFRDQIIAGMETSTELEQARQEINEFILNSPPLQPHEIQRLIDRISPLLAQTKGISPYLDVVISQSEQLHVEQVITPPIAMLIGSGVGALGMVLIVLTVSRSEEDDA